MSSCIPSTAQTSFAVTHYSMPGNEDIVLLALANAVPPAIARPAQVQTTSSGSLSSALSTGSFVMAGWGGGATTRQRATVRFASLRSDQPNGFYVNGTGGATTEQGDSGGPLYRVASSGQLTLVGINQGPNRFFATFGSGGLDSAGGMNPNLGRWFAERLTSTIPAAIPRTTGSFTYWILTCIESCARI